MLVVFVHGWSVTSTDTYGGLPAALAAHAPPGLGIEIAHVHLAKYVSFADEVTVDDIARGMQQAIVTEVVPRLRRGERFACVTHSTGGPVVRTWIDLHYRGRLGRCPLGHLVMLAPANHGSALAQLGKSRVARMKFFAHGVEPGTRVLDWLELGSDQGWRLNGEWLSYDCTSAGLYVFVLTGQTIERAFYDTLNAYTGEAGSDGVVRVAAANMNYGLIRLVQTSGGLDLRRDVRSKRTVLGVLPGLAHSGESIGILRSVKADDDGSHPTLHWLVRCLQVGSAAAYARLARRLDRVTDETQSAERRRREDGLLIFRRTFTTSRYTMLVVRLVDDRGNMLSDFDVFFTAGPAYDPNHLAPGFFVDRQRNRLNPGTLTYYIDYDVMDEWVQRPELEGRFGVRIVARPTEGFAYYTVAEYRGTWAALRQYLAPNQTVMVEVELERHVVEGVFRLTRSLVPEEVQRTPEGAPLP